MKTRLIQSGRFLSHLAIGCLLAASCQIASAQHDIRGITGPTFNLYAFPFNMDLPDGSSVHMWGFGDMGAGANATHSEGDGYNLPQYPGPTLIVNEGDAVTISLTNSGVPQPVSIEVAGHKVTATGGDPGLFSQTVDVGATATFSFTASEPGTYVYHSLGGPNPGLQMEMGLQGALIVRPAGYNATTNRVAYSAAGADYDQEFLYLLSEIDPDLHFEIERGHYTHVTQSDRYATIWLVNGRVFPELFDDNYSALYPHAPYQSIAQAHPGDRVLIREVDTGSDSHPFHHHGENLTFVARDGRVLSSDGGVTADLGRSDNTINMAPKQTVDLIWKWTGKDLNWDIYGPLSTGCTDADNNMEDDATNLEDGEEILVMCHDDICTDANSDGFDDSNHEYCADHNKAFPVALPGVQDLTLGGWWSGSPFLGDSGGLPPGEGGLNPFGGYFLVWHSHNEKELTTFDIFPGGSLSAVVVYPSYITIE